LFFFIPFQNQVFPQGSFQFQFLLTDPNEQFFDLFGHFLFDIGNDLQVMGSVHGLPPRGGREDPFQICDSAL